MCEVIAEDAAGKKQTLAKSPVLQSGKQMQHSFDVPLPAGTAKLYLVVDDAGDGANCDHADWVNAGFRKGPIDLSKAWKPQDCPFEPSAHLIGMTLTDRHAEYTGADTWYPSWASDGNLYSPWTDGTVYGLVSNSAGADATTGQAKIVGDDPLKLKIVDQAVYKSSPGHYQSRYPCGSLVYNGVWYYGTYCLHGGQIIKHEGITYNWPWLGPFVGFRHSTDFGKTWTQTPCTAEKPLFGEQSPQGRTGQDRGTAFRGLRQEHAALARRQGLSRRPRRQRRQGPPLWLQQLDHRR